MAVPCWLRHDRRSYMPNLVSEAAPCKTPSISHQLLADRIALLLSFSYASRDSWLLADSARFRLSVPPSQGNHQALPTNHDHQAALAVSPLRWQSPGAHM